MGNGQGSTLINQWYCRLPFVVLRGCKHCLLVGGNCYSVQASWTAISTPITEIHRGQGFPNRRRNDNTADRMLLVDVAW